MDNDDKTRLKTMLNYWLEHNQEHSQEFREWAGRAQALGKPEVGQEMLTAAREMDQASQALSRALKGL